MATVLQAEEKKYILEDLQSGCEIEVPYTTKEAEYTERHFWKATDSFFQLTADFTTGESKVAAYLMKRIEAMTNRFFGTYRGTARSLSCDQETVKNAFRKMKALDMVVNANSEGKDFWMFNPRLLMKGDIIKLARMAAEYDTYKEKELSTWVLIDKTTGEPFSVPLDMVDPLMCKLAEDFWKLYNEYFDILSGLSASETRVMAYLLDRSRLNYSENQILGSLDKIAKGAKCSKAAVNRAMKVLRAKGLVVMVQYGVWMINPSVIIKGNGQKKKRLERRYEEYEKIQRMKKKK